MTDEFVEQIMKEVEYEWNDGAEKALHEQLNHWISCHPESCHVLNSREAAVPRKIANDFWRDLFTSVVETIQPRVRAKCEEAIRLSRAATLKDVEQKLQAVIEQMRVLRSSAGTREEMIGIGEGIEALKHFRCILSSSQSNGSSKHLKQEVAERGGSLDGTAGGDKTEPADAQLTVSSSFSQEARSLSPTGETMRFDSAQVNEGSNPSPADSHKEATS